MYEPLDRAFSSVVEYLRHQWSTVLVLALTAILGYVVVAWVARHLVPQLIRSVVLPLIGAAIGMTAVVLLALQAMAALAFRAIRRRPPVVVYACGDAVIWATADINSGLRRADLSIARRRRIGARLIVVLMVVATVGWRYGSCDHAPASDSCRRPATAAADAVQDMWQAFGRLFPR